MTVHRAARDDDAIPVCPYCGQPLVSGDARRRVLEQEEADADGFDGEPESMSEAAKRSHDLRVQTRIF